MTAHADLIDWILKNCEAKPTRSVDLSGVRGEVMLFRFGDFIYGPVPKRNVPARFAEALKDLHPIRVHYIQESFL